MIKVEHLGKRRGRSVALDNVTLEIDEGEAMGLFGCNGSGRSTLLAVLATLVRPTTGSVTIDGIDALRRPLAVRRRIAHTAQAVRFHEALTVRKYWEITASERGLKTLLIEERIERALAWTDLNEAWPICELTVGQSQQLALAAALIWNPRVLLLDEPFCHLDPLARRQALVQLVRLKNTGTTIFIASNRLEDVDGLCDRVAVLCQGRLTAVTAGGGQTSESTESIFRALVGGDGALVGASAKANDGAADR